MKTRRTSYAFLMEMLWVCAFFLISACIFVLVFAKSERMSRDAETLNQAVQAASNAMEDTFAACEGRVSAMKEAGRRDGSSDPDSLIQNLAHAYLTDEFSLEIDTAVNDSLLSVTVTVLSNRDQSVIYTLEGDRFLTGMAAAGPVKEETTP